MEYLGFKDGLPSLNIVGIAQDSQGLIWLGAFSTGLIRYDGSTFKVYNQSPESKPRLKSNHVRDIIIDRKGRLWVAHNAGIEIIQPKTLEVLKFIPLAGDDVSIQGQACSICQDANGDIWVAAYEKGVFRFVNGNPNQLEFVEAIPHALYINQTPNGEVFCSGTMGDLYHLENGHFVSQAYDVILNWSQIKPIENAVGQLVGFRLMLPDSGSKLFQFNPLSNHFESGSPENGITVLSSPEISRRIVETASPLDKAALFGHAFRNFKDNQGVIWIAPEYGGVFKLKPRELNFITCPDLKGVSIRGMMEGPEGILYIATYNGLFQYDPRTNRAWLPKRKWEDIFFNLVKIKGSTITALSESRGIGNYDLRQPSVFNQATTSEVTRDFSFYASFPLDKDWVLAGNQKILRFRPADLKVEPFVVLPATAAVRSFCFKPSRDGKIWLGTSEGLFQLTRDGKCEEPALRQDNRLGSTSRINDVYESADGKVWFATHSYGLLCYDPVSQKILAFDQASGFASNEIYKIAGSNGDKIIWVSTFLGLQCIELENNKIHYFNELDGTSGNEFNTGSFIQTANGEFYFGGVRGLTRFDPNQFHPSRYDAPMPYVSELFIEDVYSNVINRINLPACDTLIKFSNSQNTLEFHFGSNDYFRPKNNNFYVQLLHVDADWVPLKGLSSIKYYRLAPGHYTLRVKFNANGDILSSRVFAVSFDIDEVFYKKWWFLLLACASFLGVVWWIIQIPKNRDKREQELRRVIAHDLHNTLGGKISGISNMVHVIDRLNKSGKPFQAELSQMLDLTRTTYSTMSDVIWVLTRAENQDYGLVSRMEDYTDKWLKLTHIKVNFVHNLHDKGSTIPFNVQHELIFVFKEILGNILKHTFSEEVDIQFLKNTDLSMDLIVQNRFKERKTDVISNGQGLPIIKEHISRIGGVVKTNATPHSFEVHIRFEKPVKSWWSRKWLS